MGLTSAGEIPCERVLTNSSVYETELFKRQCMDYMFFFPQQADTAEPLVPATCQVEKFLVDRTKDVGAPVTQLSDHYGVAASVAVVTTPYVSNTEEIQRERHQERNAHGMINAAFAALPAPSNDEDSSGEEGDSQPDSQDDLIQDSRDYYQSDALNGIPNDGCTGGDGAAIEDEIGGETAESLDTSYVKAAQLESD